MNIKKAIYQHPFYKDADCKISLNSVKSSKRALKKSKIRKLFEEAYYLKINS
jgi:hypothetical protein